jgi:hypothetical protein
MVGLRARNSRGRRRQAGGQISRADVENGLGAAYEGAASIGRIMALVSMVIACLVALGLFVAGGYFLNRPASTKTASVAAIVKKAQCSADNQCVVSIEYVVAGKTMSTTLQTGTPYVEGNTVTVVYDPAHPEQVEFQSNESNSMVGWILIMIGVIIAALGIGNWYLTTQSKAYAGLVGVDAAADVFD